MEPESRATVVVAVLSVLVLATIGGPATALAADGQTGPGSASTAVGAGGGSALAADRQQDDPPGQSLQTDVDTVEADRVEIAVRLSPDGNATWTIEYWTALDDANTTAAWLSLREDVRANPSNYTDRFATRIESTVRSAENATGRNMTATGYDVTAENRSLGTQTTFGVVAYEFTWTDFAVVENDSDGTRRIRAGDAIEGFFLAEETTLVVQWPEAYTNASVAPEPDDRRSNAVIWEGSSTTFVSGEPSLVVTTATGDGGGDGSGDGGADGGGDGDGGNDDAGSSGGGVGSPLLLGAVIVVVTLVGGALAYRARHDDEFTVPEWMRKEQRAEELRAEPASAQNRPATPRHVTDVPDGEAGDGTGAAGSGASADADDDGAGPDPDEGAPTAGAADGSDGGDADGSDDLGDLPPELLSNEEQVLKFLREAGGRAKQQEIVQALDWTEAKTSQVVSGMREEGTIDGFRLGRENVLTLPDVDIEVGPDDEDDGDDEDDR